jgi:hypothetical protein
MQITSNRRLHRVRFLCGNVERLFPHTPRELIQQVFLLCGLFLSGGALWELFHGQLDIALYYLASDYTSVIGFFFVYGRYAKSTPGESLPDCGRFQPRGPALPACFVPAGPAVS